MTLPVRKAHWLGLAGVVLAALVLLVILFGPVLADPNNYFFQAGGDALQSYYVTAYYALFDMGNRFTGMNYPYGEHINYPNLQPAVAVGMGLLQRLGVPTARYTVGITNVLALGSIVVTSGIMYAILRRTRLPVLYSVGVALVISFMSPQVLRLDGHLSLSYACTVAWLWYCIIRMQEQPRRWRWYVVFGLSSLVIGSVMPYFLALGCFFLLGHVLVLAWQQPRLRPWLWRMVLAAALPLLVFRGYLWATDHVTDRPPNPYGLLVFVASPGTVFTPVLGPLHDWWQQHWPRDSDNDEGFAYIGLVSTATLAVSLVLGLGAVLLRRQWARLRRPALPQHLYSGLGAAALLLFVAFGYPFKWHVFDWLTDHAGPVKQFRSLGRFAWPFYYVATTYTAYYLYRLYRYLRRSRQQRALVWLGLPILLLWATEAWLQVSTKAGQVMVGVGARDFLDPHTGLISRLSWANRDISDFQAIMPLPYYNIGTDKFDQSGSGNSIYQAYKASATTGLPLLANHTPRASVGQAMQHIQLLSSDLIGKELLTHFPNQKPILLLVTPDYLTEAEQRLIGLAHLLVQAPEGSLYELPLAALAATALPQTRAQAAALLPTLPVRPGGVQASTPAGVLVQGFDAASDRRGRLGPGALYAPQDGFTTLYDGPVPAPADTGSYEASVWINGKTKYGFGNMRVKLYDATGMVNETVTDSRKATEVQGDWVRIVVPFRVRPGITRLEVLYENRDLLADDLLIRPVNTDVYYHVGPHKEQLVKNTYPLTP